ncbi:MAG: hypothetical protein IKN87_01850 [Bacilli bacterium]|nr:hypothetical protein [Bacilli bacterium]
MILVTLGTQDKKFYRILRELDRLIEAGKIKDKVVVQAGDSADYESKNMEIFDLIPMDDFNKLMNKCDLLITHGGVGSIIDGLKRNKKIIAIARLSKYNEHHNDHQLQIVENFSNAGYILNLRDISHLEKMIEKTKTFKPKKYVSNTDNMVKLVDDLIKS